MTDKKIITEWGNPDTGLSLRVNHIIHEEQTPFQNIKIVDTLQYGRMMILDDVFQTSVKDEWMYHEMIAHIPLMLHPCPERVLIIGGGDGGCAREVCKHDCVKQVDLCDIDQRVYDLSKEYFPSIAEVLLHPLQKLHIHTGDGIAFAGKHADFYDVIIIDCSDPIGPGEGLFTKEFYQSAFKALRKDGVLVQQSESPIVQQSLVHEIFNAMNTVFPIVRMYYSHVAIYPACLHSFMLASKKYDPLTDEARVELLPDMKYYNKKIQKSAFVLPNFIKACLYEGKYSF
ncbi:polyamine aminopropyltransferase [Dialister pneumosintes]|uniref:Polyamine aminopropyltransferase n=1 Tax=Dialister pneumosintes TaxID=39950 RepID=A0ABX9MC53_9FIRM|nr:polyamine aminopropyltransferase [Dialister pneumosintes]RID94732.1 polyamine aminopropyltransferase [Dialister pneumosintes]